MLLHGRFEIIENDMRIPVVTDFASVPESFETVLKAAKLYSTGRVVAVFGAEGEKNQEQREKLGQVAGKLADISIITTFNPRNENVNDISNEVLKGVRKVKGKGIIIEDRKEAIEFALKKAQKRDMIVLLGLGHNKFMELKGKKIPFNEKEIVKEYIKKRMSEETNEKKEYKKVDLKEKLKNLRKEEK